MYSKKLNSINSVPSDAQAKEKLALYVYEYLHYVGATQSAETFLSEIQWNKQITLGEKPGFLQSWWCVFWDLYCAAPERRDSNEHSPEAKMFHDYNCNMGSAFITNGMHGPNPTPSPIGLPPSDGMAPGPAGMGPPPHGFFPPGVPGPHMRPSPPQQNVSQPSPHAMMSQSGFMPARYPQGPRGGMRLPPQDQSPYGASPGPPMFPDQMRLGGPGGPQMIPPHAAQQRLGPAGHSRMPPMNQNNFPMRPLVNTSMGPGMGSGAHMPRWPASMQYIDPGPGQFPGSSMSVNNGPPPGGPGTPIMRSPHSMPDGPPDRFGMMQSGGPPMGAFPMTSEQSGNVALGEMLMNGDGMDIKNSPASAHGRNGTPGPGGGANGPPGLVGGVGGPNSAPPPVSSESCSLDYSGGAGPSGPGSMHPFQTGSSAEQEAEIQKIKDSIAEESKTYLSKDRPSSEGGDYFNMR